MRAEARRAKTWTTGFLQGARSGDVRTYADAAPMASDMTHRSLARSSMAASRRNRATQEHDLNRGLEQNPTCAGMGQGRKPCMPATALH
jgi:hypothetical protein